MSAAGVIITYILLPVTAVAVPAAAIALWRIGRNLARMATDFHGEPARPGFEARPGVMERLQGQGAQLGELQQRVLDIGQHVAVVAHEVQPNGGKSIKDQLNRLDPEYQAPPVDAGEDA